jgi:hypothetical protein
MTVRQHHQPTEPALFLPAAMSVGLPDRPAMNQAENTKPLLICRANDILNFQLGGPFGTDFVEFENHNFRSLIFDGAFAPKQTAAPSGQAENSPGQTNVVRAALGLVTRKTLPLPF